MRNWFSKLLDPERWSKKSHEGTIVLFSLLSGYPGVLTGLLLLWYRDFPNSIRWSLSVIILGAWFAFNWAIRKQISSTFEKFSILLSSLQRGEPVREVQISAPPQGLAEILTQIRNIADTLKQERLHALETTAILRTVMAEIDIAIFAFDSDQRLQWVNQAGERLLARPSQKMIGETARTLELAPLLQGELRRTLQASFPGATSRWGIRRSTFREHGKPHQLLVIEDLSLPLREEERQAWQRLVRVLGHELNNSLAPIKSITESLQTLSSNTRVTFDWKEDLNEGLDVISSRVEALNRFMQAYAKLAKMPEPIRRKCNVASIVTHVARMETRMEVTINPGSLIYIHADSDQLEQMLINLVRNAADAALEIKGKVIISWTADESRLYIQILDEGPGLPETANLFVPFFTTKASGTGIGLALSRQIAEAHGGTLLVQNRKDRSGCRALVALPKFTP